MSVWNKELGGMATYSHAHKLMWVCEEAATLYGLRECHYVWESMSPELGAIFCRFVKTATNGGDSEINSYVVSGKSVLVHNNNRGSTPASIYFNVAEVLKGNLVPENSSWIAPFIPLCEQEGLFAVLCDCRVTKERMEWIEEIDNRGKK